LSGHSADGIVVAKEAAAPATTGATPPWRADDDEGRDQADDAAPGQAGTFRALASSEIRTSSDRHFRRQVLLRELKSVPGLYLQVFLTSINIETYYKKGSSLHTEMNSFFLFSFRYMAAAARATASRQARETEAPAASRLPH
jgi:hypothetical protein